MDFTHKEAFDTSTQSPLLCKRRALRKILQHICEVRAKQPTAKERNWVQPGGFDRSAARSSMKSFPQIWNVVFFT